MKQTTRDNVIYLGVAGIIVAALAFYIFYTDKAMGRIPEIPGPILWGMISTPGIVALILEQFWVYRRQRWPWVISFVAASVNVSVMTVAYWRRWNPPVIVWSTITVLWVTFLLVVGNKFAVRSRKPVDSQ